MRLPLSAKDIAFFKAMNHALIYGPFILGALVLFVIPPEIIDGIPMLGQILNGVADWIPAIAETAKTSLFPNEARDFLSLTFITAPVQITAAMMRLRSTGYASHQLAYWRTLDRTELRTIRLGAPVMTIVGALGLLLIGEDPDICQACTSHSKLGLFFFGGLGPLVIGLMAYFSVLLLRHYRALVPTEPK